MIPCFAYFRENQSDFNKTTRSSSYANFERKSTLPKFSSGNDFEWPYREMELHGVFGDDLKPGRYVLVRIGLRCHGRLRKNRGGHRFLIVRNRRGRSNRPGRVWRDGTCRWRSCGRSGSRGKRCAFTDSYRSLGVCQPTQIFGATDQFVFRNDRFRIHVEFVIVPIGQFAWQKNLGNKIETNPLIPRCANGKDDGFRLITLFDESEFPFTVEIEICRKRRSANLLAIKVYGRAGRIRTDRHPPSNATAGNHGKQRKEHKNGIELGMV